MGGELVKAASLKTNSEIFREAFPYYLSIGMTYEQYWNMDCQLVKYYRESQKIKETRKNNDLWLQGMYFYDVLCRVSPVFHAFAKEGTKPMDYIDSPYPLTKEEQEERRIENERKRMLAIKESFQRWVETANFEEKEEGGNLDGSNN